MRWTRLITSGLTAILVAALLSAAGPADAQSPDSIKGTQHHVTYWLNHETGTRMYWWNPGDTVEGHATITGFHRGVSGRYTAQYTVTIDSPSPLARGLSGPVVQPNSWYNPTTWDWLGILGWTWTNIVEKCLKGALAGVVGTASGTLIVNLMIKGAKVFVGAWGYAALAIGGCTVGMIGL